MNIHIRKIFANDTLSFMHFLSQLESESDYLLHEPEVRCVQRIEKNLKRIKEDKSSVLYCAVENEKIVGFICGEVDSLKRINHIMRVNIGILKNYRGIKLGKRLSIKLLKHAKQHGILRLEASVVKNNVASLMLCKKFGMEMEGVKKAGIKIKGEFFDVVMLGKILE